MTESGLLLSTPYAPSVDVLGRVDELTDVAGGSVDAATGAALGPIANPGSNGVAVRGFAIFKAWAIPWQLSQTGPMVPVLSWSEVQPPTATALTVRRGICRYGNAPLA